MFSGKIISRNPDIVTVNANIIFHRIDPNPHRPKYIDSDIKLEKFSNTAKLSQLLLKGKQGLSGGATPLGANYVANGVRFIRTGEVKDCWIDASKCAFISIEDDNAIKRSRLLASDVLLTITGACFGKSAVVSNELLPANISQHSVRIRTKQELNPYFLVAYLNSSTGQLQIFKQTVGSTRQAIDYIGIREIRVPIPDRRIQDYIGAKIELAERCRTEAAFRIKRVQTCLAEVLGVDLFQKIDVTPFTKDTFNVLSTRPSCSVVAPEGLMGMIGAHCYAPIHIAVEAVLENEGLRQHSFAEIAVEVVNGFDCREFVESGTPYIKVADLKPGRLEKSKAQKVALRPTDIPEKQRILDGDLLITRKGSYGICASVMKRDEDVIISSEIIRVRLNSEFIADYVAAFLNSEFGHSKFDRVATGTMMLGISHGNLADIRIPWIGTDSQKLIATEHGLWRESLETTDRLVAEAKSDIEAMIGGTLDTKSIQSSTLKPPTWEDIKKELKEKNI